MPGMQAVLERLAQASTAADPYDSIGWPEQLPPGQWCMTPELISLHGTPVYERMDEASRHQLSLLELVNFFSINVHGERRLIAGLGERLGAEPDPAVASYLQHFVGEEEKHLACFQMFCDRYANGVYRDRNLALPDDWNAAEAVFVFFARVLMFEELVDQINTTLAADERVAAVVRQINHAHHLDEVRHIAFGRVWLRHLATKTRTQWRRDGSWRIGRYLSDYRTALWRDLFNPDVYRDVGLTDPLGLRSTALANAQVRSRCRGLFARSDRLLAELQLPIEAVPA